MASVKKITMREYNGTDYDTLYPKTIASQVDGIYGKDEILNNSTKALYGLANSAVPNDVFNAVYYSIRSTVTITSLPNVTFTMKIDGNVEATGTTDSSGKCVLFVKKLGDYTLTGTYAGSSWSQIVRVPYVGLTDIVAVPSLEEASWSLISAISENGKASSVFSVGDKKTIAVDGVNYKIQIIGFSHDTKTAGGKAGITFQLVDCLNTTYKMNATNTNVGGWKNSTMRTSTMASLLNNLSSDLKNVIKAVNKPTSAGNAASTIETVSDKLFLLSEIEVFGSTEKSFAGEGSQYAWYQAGNSVVKNVNGTASNQWERSPAISSTVSFCIVQSTGKSNLNGAGNSLGVSFAFCV